MELIFDFISANQGVNYQILLACVGFYLLLFWLAISVWAARDAMRRYDHNSAAVLWFALIFVLNFPALLFYFIVRPEEPWEASRVHAGGVNVPLVNFVGGENEFVFGLELKINGSELTEQVRDMKLTIDWDSVDQAKQISSESLVAEADVAQQKLNRVLGRLRGNIKSQGESVRSFLGNIRTNKSDASVPLAPAEPEVTTEITEDETSGEANVTIKDAPSEA